MIKAVIFDRDGVLIDSESLNVKSAEYAFSQLGIVLTENDKMQVVGRHPNDFKKNFISKYDFSWERFYKIKSENYYDQYPKVNVFSKTLEFLRKIKSRYKLGLTTSGSIRGTNILIQRLKLKNTFDVIVTFEDCKNRKPAPDPYLITTQKLNLKPEECLVIEDTRVGVESAKSAGCICIAFPNEFTKHQDFSKADLIVNSADEIKKFLNKHNTK
ncbi:MAG: Phosphoglycolate phosphatase [Candidatus Woesearchaeota archaeon]|nr:Phosphoglycolate phosphatase [Candidatus Woesearchaeota archaeon]